MRPLVRVIVLATALLTAFCVDAGADDSSATIQYLEGGSLTTGVHMSLGFLYGAGSRPDGLGSPVSSVHAGLGAVSGNPAGLAYLRDTAVLVDILPPFGVSASDFVDMERVAEEMIDDATDGHTAPGFEPVYPTLAAELGQDGGVISGAFGLRVGRVFAAAAIEEPMSMTLEMVDTGLEAFGSTTKEEGDDLIDIQIRCMADAAADLAFEVDRSTLAAASDVGHNVAVGLSLSRYHGIAVASGSVRADGIIDYAGQEYAFNDPSDPWDNELGMSARGAFEGDAWGWNLGLSWRPTDALTVDAVYANMPALKLEGSLVTVTNLMPGLEDGEYDLDQILDSQPTLTERKETVEDDPVTLLLPSQGGLAVSYQLPFVLATVEYRRYTGAFGFEYQEESEGIDVSDGFGLEFDFGGLVLGGGVIRGTLMGESVADGGPGDPVLIPMANLGLGIDLGPNMRLDTMLMAVPLQVMRASIGYEF